MKEKAIFYVRILQHDKGFSVDSHLEEYATDYDGKTQFATLQAAVAIMQDFANKQYPKERAYRVRVAANESFDVRAISEDAAITTAIEWAGSCEANWQLDAVTDLGTNNNAS